MLNFAVGPVPSDPNVKLIGGEDSPYFRTPEFSLTMLENERMLCELAHAPEGSRAIFLTNSGTGAMEAAVMGLLDPGKDRALVVDGGSFGHRFRQMLSLHDIEHTAIEIEPGNILSPDDLISVRGEYTTFLVNLGVHPMLAGPHELEPHAWACRFRGTRPRRRPHIPPPTF